MKPDFRCGCPITSALDIIGDRWSMVIIKQMLLSGARTFKDFSEQQEAIATNILAARLKRLEGYGILTKQKHPTNKKVNLYRLTERGIALAPAIMELGLWSHRYLGDIHPELTEDMVEAERNPAETVRRVQEGYRSGNS